MTTHTPDLLLTHPGGAHRDEFLALALLLAQHPSVPVERRGATADEMENPSVWVVDEGLRHDATKGLFDHHQLPASEGRCALTLILEFTGLLETAREAWPWLRMTELRDVAGPSAVMQELGVSGEVLASLETPVERAMLDWFAECTRLLPGEVLHQGLVRIGSQMLADLEAWSEAANAVPSIEWVELAGLRCALLQSESVRPYSLTEVLRKRGALPAILIHPDNRGPGWSLTRIDDHPRVDFRRLAGDERISFIHGNGFVAKTAGRYPREHLTSLLKRSISE